MKIDAEKGTRVLWLISAITLIGLVLINIVNYPTTKDGWASTHHAQANASR